MKTLNLLLLASAIVVAKPSPGTPDAFKAGIGKAYQGYLNIQQALANDDLQKAKKGAESMLGSLKGVPAKGLSATAQPHWDSLSTGLMGALKPMTASKDIADLRSKFKELTPLL